MRVQKLNIERFGPLARRAFPLEPGINLIFGPNESGKSSFVAALETVLFGFEPATRDAHPLFRWNERGGDLQLDADLKLASGTVLRVERTLQKTGKRRLAAEGQPFEGRRDTNGPLVEVAGVERSLFRAVYALGAEDLLDFASGVRRSIDHLLMPESGLEGFRPTWSVLQRLREDRDAQWREDRRGKPRERELREQLTAAKRALAEAVREEQELVRMREERSELVAERQSLQLELDTLEADERDAAILQEIFEVRSLRQLRPNSPDLRPLCGDPLVDPTLVARELGELEAQLDRPRAHLAERGVTLLPHHAPLLARADELDRSLAAVGHQEANGEELDELDSRHDERVGECRNRIAKLVGTPRAESAIADIRALPLEALNIAVESWREAEADALSAREARSGLSARLTLALLFAFGSAGIVVAALLGRVDSEVGVGAVAVGAAAVIVAFSALARRPEVPDAALDPDVREQLESAGVHPALFHNPTALARLLDSLRHVESFASEADRIERRSSELRKRMGTREAEWRRLCADFQIAPGENPAASLRQELDEAIHQQQLLRASAERTRSAREAIASLEPALRRKQVQLERLRATLTANCEDERDPSAAFESLREQLEADASLSRRERALRSRVDFARLSDDPRTDPDGLESERPWTPGSVESRRATTRELRERRDAIQHRLGEIDAHWSRDRGSREAEARETVQAIQRERVRCQLERDRLALLERVLVSADRQYRAEHQPDVLRRASSHLKLISGGRYDRLEFPDGPDGQLWVQPAHGDEPVIVGPPLSRGTRDQIFLALRLGLLDHLDVGRERLPLILDEALVHWDRTRRRSAYRLLREVAKTRQVFFMTCHDVIADEAARSLGIPLIALGDFNITSDVLLPHKSPASRSSSPQK